LRNLNSNVLLVTLALLMQTAPMVAAGSNNPSQPRGKPAEGESFSFVVIGDSRTPGGPWATVKVPEVSPVFTQLIEQINLTSPDLVAITGDLIWGHCDRDMAIRQWEAFDQALDRLVPPCYLVVGNHDIWNDWSAELYTRRYGPMWYSFNHKGAHFIVLNTEVPNKSGSIGPEQLEWLADDLATHADYKFKYVFLHQPLWAYGGETPDIVPRTRMDGLYQLWMSQVHPLLKQYGVDVVFGGHWHQYLAQKIDGLRYVTTGGGGGELGGNQFPPELLGRFYHYLIVTVRNGKTHILVAKLDGIMPDDVITPETLKAAAATRFSYSELRTDFGTFEGKMLLAPGAVDGAGHIWVEPEGGNPLSFVNANMYTVSYDPAAEQFHRRGAAAVGRRIMLPAEPADILDVSFSVDHANWRTDRTGVSKVWLMVVPASSWDHAGGYTGPGDYDLSQPDPAIYVEEFATPVAPDEFPSLEIMSDLPMHQEPRGGTFPIAWSKARADRDRLLSALRAHAGQAVVFVVQVRGDWANTRVWGHLDNLAVEVVVRDGNWPRILATQEPTQTRRSGK
jgi:3',5'-cyclic AMP phosphodiesterase CpdA